MIRKLVKHGDQLALVLEASLLAELKIDEQTELELSIERGQLRIAPAATLGLSEAEFQRIHDSISERYAQTFKRLAEES